MSAFKLLKELMFYFFPCKENAAVEAEKASKWVLR